MKRNCPECKNRTLEVPMLGASYLCFNCMPRFVQPWWFNLIFSFSGVLTVYMVSRSVLSTLNEFVLIAVLILSYVASDFFIKFIGPVKLVGIKALRKK